RSAPRFIDPVNDTGVPVILPGDTFLRHLLPGLRIRIQEYRDIPVYLGKVTIPPQPAVLTGSKAAVQGGDGSHGGGREGGAEGPYQVAVEKAFLRQITFQDGPAQAVKDDHHHVFVILRQVR